MKPEEFFYLSSGGRRVPPMPEDGEPGTYSVDITVDAQRYVGKVRKAQPEEEPMSELKPCPICPSKAAHVYEGRTRCDSNACPLGQPGTWIPIPAWQALPRPEKGEEERICRTCFFATDGCPCAEYDLCDDNHSRWRPNRPGDEVRIREIVEREAATRVSHYAPNVPSLLGWVTEAGLTLARHMGVSCSDALRARMAEATQRLGPWDVHDGRDYRREALEELLDAAFYLAAEKVREEGR